MIAPKAKISEEPQIATFYEKYGIFLNDSTLEIELNNAGCIRLMNAVMQALCDVKAAKERFQQLASETMKANMVINNVNRERFIQDIEYVGKGRFAQRLSAELCKLDPKYKACPPYILKAIKYVAQKTNNELLVGF